MKRNLKFYIRTLLDNSQATPNQTLLNPKWTPNKHPLILRPLNTIWKTSTSQSKLRKKRPCDKINNKSDSGEIQKYVYNTS